jgi:transcription elongation GreA/GreB family factor
MSSARKAHFVEELKQVYTAAIEAARQAEVSAAEASNEIQREARRREDSKGAVEAGRLAVGHRRRRQRAIRELETLIAFASRGLHDSGPNDPVALGSLVDVSTEDEHEREERTLFVLPVGAGNELAGPGGDGFVFVVTPGSPIGRALVGARAGECVEVVVDSHDREWTIVDVC